MAMKYQVELAVKFFSEGESPEEALRKALEAIINEVGNVKFDATIRATGDDRKFRKTSGVSRVTAYEIKQSFDIDTGEWGSRRNF